MHAGTKLIQAVTLTLGLGLAAQHANAAVLATPDAVIKAYESALNGSEASTATDLFTTGAVLLQAGNPAVIGRTDILSFFTGQNRRTGLLVRISGQRRNIRRL